VVISTADGDPVESLGETIGQATNNVAEYRALLRGLERANELGASEVRVFGDSQLVIKQVAGEYKVKHPDMRPLHADAIESLAKFARWSVNWVPRERNAGADALVNRALDESSGS